MDRQDRWTRAAAATLVPQAVGGLIALLSAWLLCAYPVLEKGVHECAHTTNHGRCGWQASWPSASRS
jgi:hypothetical protein